MPPITAIITGVLSLVDRIFPDKTAAQKAAFEAAMAEMMAEKELALKQIEVNVAEAQSSNLFVAGWRPCLGWVCALIFAWTYLLRPLVEFLAASAGHPVPHLPALDLGEIMPVLLGMLGVGTLRTVEKIKGVAR